MLKYGAHTNKFGFTVMMIRIFIHWWSPYVLPCFHWPGYMLWRNLWFLDLLHRFIGYTPGGITINYNTFSNSHIRGLLATRYIFTGRLLLPLWTSRGYLLPRTNLELNWTELASIGIGVALHILRAHHTENSSRCSYCCVFIASLRSNGRYASLR
jgi:hypothetical protein